MVIILRVGVLAPLGVLKVATTMTVFLETLTMMAVEVLGGTLFNVVAIGCALDTLGLGLDDHHLSANAPAAAARSVAADSARYRTALDERLAGAHRLAIVRYRLSTMTITCWPMV